MKRFLAITSALLFVWNSGCKNESPSSPTPPSTQLTLGESVDAASSVIANSGGTVSVSKSGSPVDGMTITVPPGSYVDPRTFSISYASITGHKFGTDFNPISPLITITNGGGYADSPMVVRVPCHVPVGNFAMAFVFDEATGQLEGLPLIACDSNGVTFQTRQFGFNVLSPHVMGKLAGESWAKILISTIDAKLLAGLITSNFTPGVDDWEFTNYGSFASAMGICSGMTFTAMYYYDMLKPHLAAGLFNRYDSLHGASMWMDNRSGIRLASMNQVDYEMIGGDVQWKKYFIPFADTWYDQYLAFAYSIRLTNKPQYVAIHGSAGGHAMVVYAVNNGTMSVSDPNWPGVKTRVITYNNGTKTFDAYFGGLSKLKPGHWFPEVYYIARGAIVDWKKMADRWSEFDAGTIGDGCFPPYSLWVQDGSGYPLADGLNTDNDTLPLQLRCPTAPSQDPACLRFDVYDGTGALLVSSGAKNSAVIQLTSGINRIGIHVQSQIIRDCSGGSLANADTGWLDFKWFTVFHAGVTIMSLNANQAPFLSTGSTDSTYTIVATGLANRPAQTRYVWSFGDGSSNVTRTNDTTVQHKFSTTGDLNVSVDVLNNTSGTKLAHATAVAHLSGAMQITSIVPDSGAAGADVVITGHGFGKTQGPNARVYFGTRGTDVNYALAAEIVSWSDTKITCVAPYSTGALKVFIDPGNSKYSNQVSFTMFTTTIKRLSPTHGLAGTVDTIIGKGFGATQGTSYVQYRGDNGNGKTQIQLWSDTLIITVIPDSSPDLKNVTLQVWVRGAYLSNEVVFAVDLNYRKWLALCTKMEVHFAGDDVYRLDMNGTTRYDTISWDHFIFGWGADGSGTPHLRWTGTHFYDSIRCTNGNASGYTTVQGDVSQDGRTLLTLTGSYYLYEPDLSNRITTASITFTNVSFDSSSSQYRFSLSRTKGAIPGCVQFHKVVDASHEPSGGSVSTYITTVWNSTRASAVAEIIIDP